MSGQNPLPGTVKELERIRHHVGELPIEVLADSDASVESVVAGMMRNSWVHLACHGTQQTGDPTQSALILHGGHLQLARIIQLRLIHARFAFLSACQTASGDPELEEEAVHLAAGMLLAGYRGVVATSWSIQDEDAPVIADEVYAEILRDANPDPSKAARALQKAVHNRRRRGASPLSWAPFIHFGI